MTRRFDWLLPCVIVLMGLVAGGVASAEDKDDWIQGRLFTPEQILKAQARLQLTDRQREAIGIELRRVQADVAEIDWQILSEGTEVQTLIEQHPVDARAVLARVDRVLAAEARKKRLYVEMLVNIKNQLTAEQVAILRGS
jgi:uncharacterized membrane protein